MTTSTENTWQLFTSASLSDDGGDYPDHVEFVPWGITDWVQVTLSNLREGVPTVIGTDEIEYLLLPHPRHGFLHLLDLVRREPWAEVYWRHGGHSHGGLETKIDRRSLERLEHDPQFA